MDTIFRFKSMPSVMCVIDNSDRRIRRERNRKFGFLRRIQLGRTLAERRLRPVGGSPSDRYQEGTGLPLLRLSQVQAGRSRLV